MKKKSEIKLKPKHKAVLGTLCDCCASVDRSGKYHISIGMHVAPEYVQRKLKTQYRNKVKTALDYLCAKGLAQQHPTGGSMTYHLTNKGLEVAHQLGLFENG